MDETDKNTDPDNQEIFEDIQNVTFDKNIHDPLSVIASATGLGMLASLLSSAANALFTPEEQDRMWEGYKEANRKELERSKAEQEREEQHQEKKRKVLNEEAQAWESIQRDTSQTSVLFYIFNNTTETFKFDFSSWDRSKQSQEDNEIGPRQHKAFALHSDIPQRPHRKARYTDRLNHQFSCRSSKYAFDFSTQMVIRISRPIRNHQIQSIGNSNLKCTCNTTRASPGIPYSYGITIILG